MDLPPAIKLEYIPLVNPVVELPLHRIHNYCIFLHRNPNSDNDDIDIEWKPIRPEQRSHLQIDKELRFIEERINEKRRQFWENLLREVIMKEEKQCRFSLFLRLLGFCL